NIDGFRDRCNKPLCHGSIEKSPAKMQSLLTNQYSSCYHRPLEATGFHGKFPASEEFKPTNLA
ncbi:MAG: hypothetical protein ACI3UA_08610, partial [Anaerovibrio sp.]